MNRAVHAVESSFLALVVALFMVGVAEVMIWATGGCGASGASATRTAVTTLAEVIDPTYDLAVDGCVVADQNEVTAERDRGQKPEVTDQNRAEIRARCDRLRAAFDGMVKALARAEQLLDQGDTAGAETLLQEVRKSWAALPPH